MNVDADLIVSGISLLKSLNAQPGNPSDHHVLVSVDDLQRTFAYYFEQGAAAERFFSNADVFQQIVVVSNTLKEKKVSLEVSLGVVSRNVVHACIMCHIDQYAHT